MALYIGSTKVAGGNIMGVNEMIAYVIDLLYPVGAIFSSIDDTDPSEHFGFGIWQNIGDTDIFNSDGTISKVYMWKRIG